MTAGTLNSLLARHGDVRSVKVMTDVMTGRCSGVAYIVLDEVIPGSARAALDGSSHGGRIIQAGVDRKWGRSIWHADSKPVE